MFVKQYFLVNVTQSQQDVSLLFSSSDSIQWQRNGGKDGGGGEGIGGEGKETDNNEERKK